MPMLGWTPNLVQILPHRSECGHHVRLCRGGQPSDSRGHPRPGSQMLRSPPVSFTGAELQNPPMPLVQRPRRPERIWTLL